MDNTLEDAAARAEEEKHRLAQGTHNFGQNVNQGFHSFGNAMNQRAHQVNAGLHDAEISLENQLRKSVQNVDNKFSETGRSIDDTISHGVDESNKRAHAGLDDISNATANIFGKSLLPKE